MLILQLRLIICRFIEMHPGAVSPLNIKTYKGFMEFLGRNIKGQLDKNEVPMLDILKGKRRKLDAGLASRGLLTLENISIIIQEVSSSAPVNLKSNYYSR